MKSKKLIIMLIILCLIVTGLVLSAAKKKSDSQVTLRFSWWGNDARHKATLEAIELYMKLNPNVKILPEYSGAQGYQEKKKIELPSGTAPDVMQIDYTWIEEFNSMGNFFVDLSKLHEINTKTFDAKFLKDYCTFGGKLLGLPTGVNAQLLLINKTAATKMGVNLNNLKDWDSILVEGKKLHDKDNKYNLLLHDPSSFAGEVLGNMPKEVTGKYSINDDYTMNFTKADYVRMYTWLSEAVKNGTLEAPGDANVYAYKGEQNPKWINQQIICAIVWASAYSPFILKDTEFILMIPPTVKNAKTGCSQLRPSQEFCINNKSQNITEGAKFINWLLNDKEAAVILGDVRSIPASSTARNAAAAAGKIKKITSDAVSLAMKNSIILEKKFGFDRQIVQIGLDVAMKAEFGTLTPEQAADENIKLTKQKLEELKAAQK